MVVGNPLLVLVGAGPGVGDAVARRFGREGYDVALISRDAGRLQALGEALQEEGITTGWTAADVADENALRAAIRRFGRREDRIDALHFNPSVFRQLDPLRLSLDDLLADVRVGVGGLLVATQAARPFLRDGSRITATGSMAADQPWHEAASLGVQKAALRNLVYSLDATLEGGGVRAVSVTVRGTLAPDDETSPLHPARVAGAIWSAAHQPDESWRTEVLYPTR